MVNIDALLKALPVSGLQPLPIAFISGLTRRSQNDEWQDSLVLVEPPAGGPRVPFIDPLRAVERLLRYMGEDDAGALARAQEVIAALLYDVPEQDRVRFYDYLDMDVPECIPVPALLGCLAKHSLVPNDVLAFLDSAVKTAMDAVRFHDPDNRDAPWRFDELPSLPPPKAMIEFFPGPPWDEGYENGGPTGRLFVAWRNRIKPIVASIEQATGQQAYYFSDLDDELDDDLMHRFLLLHWCCSHAPQSTYTNYLLRVSGASGVDELLRALEAPERYRHPFEMNDAFISMETDAYRANWRDRPARN